MCVCVCVYVNVCTCAWDGVPGEAKRRYLIPGVGVMGSCEPFDVVLREAYALLTAEVFL